MKKSTATRLAERLNADAAGLRRPRAFVVDPGKLGRIASSAPDSARYKFCGLLTEAFARSGQVTVHAVLAAANGAGL